MCSKYITLKTNGKIKIKYKKRKMLIHLSRVMTV